MNKKKRCFFSAPIILVDPKWQRDCLILFYDSCYKTYCRGNKFTDVKPYAIKIIKGYLNEIRALPL
jgi:hypothetical protein